GGTWQAVWAREAAGVVIGVAVGGMRAAVVVGIVGGGIAITGAIGATRPIGAASVLLDLHDGRGVSHAERKRAGERCCAGGGRRQQRSGRRDEQAGTCCRKHHCKSPGFLDRLTAVIKPRRGGFVGGLAVGWRAGARGIADKA